MNLQAISVGIIFLAVSFILFLIEKTTPKNERVPVRIWFSQSHESVYISIVAMLAMGAILIIIGPNSLGTCVRMYYFLFSYFF